MRLFYHCLFIPALLCLPFFIQAQAYFPADTLYGLQWENLDFPVGRVLSFAKSGNTHFAVTRRGLFMSFDGGQNWKIHPQFGETGSVIKVVASGDVVFVEKERTVINTNSYIERYRDFYRSADQGATFSLSISLDNSFDYFDCIHTVGGIYAKNDSTFFIPWLNGHCDLASNKFERIVYTNDRGLTWQTRQNIGRYGYSMQDSLVLGYTQEGAVIRICSSTADDFSGTVSTTIPAPPGFNSLNNNVLLLVKQQNNTLFLTVQQQLYQSTDDGQTWTDDSLNIPGGRLHFAFLLDGQIYTGTDQGIFKADPATPLATTNIYAAGAGHNFSFQKFGAELWNNDLSGITYRSDDAGQTWVERSRGLGHETAGIREWCDYLVVSPGVQNDSIKYRSQTGGQWERLTSAPGVGTYFSNYLGETDDWLFMNVQNTIRRSADCGLTWEDCPAQLTGISTPTNTGPLYAASNNGRFYLYCLYNTLRTIWHTADGGASWATIQVPASSQTPNSIRQLILHQDTLLVVQDATIARTTDLGATWTTINLPSTVISAYGSIRQHGQKLLFTSPPEKLKLMVSSDDGATWTQTCADFYDYGASSYPSHTPIKYVKDGVIFIHAAHGLYLSKNDGVNWMRLADLPFVGEFPAAAVPLEGGYEYLLKDDYLYASTFRQGLWRTPWQPILDALNTTQGDYGQVEGRVFFDRDHDCTFSAGDQPLGGRVVRLTPGNFYTATAPDGTYRFAAPTATYQVETVLPDNTQDVCNAQQNQTVTLTAGSTAAAIFPVFVVPGTFDLCLNLFRTQPLRVGFETAFKANVVNTGSETVSNAPLTFQFDPTVLNFIEASLPVQINGGTLTILLPTLQPNETVNIVFHFEIPMTITLGTPVDISASIALANDAHPGNNTVELNDVVTGAYDPNDKTAYPAEALTPGSPHPLLYVIRFQNTGTDTAFNVVVTDTIDQKLDLLSLETISASHAYTFSMHPNRVVKWTFKSILLPDSTINEAESHGYITFKIKTLPLADQEIIRNHADIFFDFNESVLTNTVEVEIKKLLVQQSNPWLETGMVRVAPNPAAEGVWITILPAATSALVGPNWSLYNLTGQLVSTGKLTGRETFLPRHDLADGCYFLKIMGQGEVVRVVFGH